MKYEAVFGNQELFNGVSCAAIIVIKSNSTGRYTITENECSDIVKLNVCQPDIEIAMRRIIQEPKRWTVEDQKAGRLPEVGAMYDVSGRIVEHLGVGVLSNSKTFYFRFPSGDCGLCDAILIKPLETPEEKAERLRSEWSKDAAKKYKDDGENVWEWIHDALLSGTLSVPTKGGE